MGALVAPQRLPYQISRESWCENIPEGVAHCVKACVCSRLGGLAICLHFEDVTASRAKEIPQLSWMWRMDDPCAADQFDASSAFAPR